jgi:hypothetical protein
MVNKFWQNSKGAEGGRVGGGGVVRGMRGAPRGNIGDYRESKTAYKGESLSMKACHSRLTNFVHIPTVRQTAAMIRMWEDEYEGAPDASQ